VLLLAGTVLAVLLVRPLGGRLRPLAGLALRGSGLLLAGLGLQVLCFVVLTGAPRPLLVGLHAVSYVLAAVFVVLNRAVPGIGLIAVGACLNALALTVNGGTMPASESAVRAAGLPLVEEGYSNSGVLVEPRLAFLGDVFASPSWLPLQNVYSPGDLLVLAGAVWAVHRTCRSVLARDPRPALARVLGRQPRPDAQPRTASAGMGRLSR